jgi:acetyltransferase-like isoleucine patch superfamily enzyme
MKKILVFGTGKKTLDNLLYISMNYEIVGFIDNFKSGKFLYKKIYNPSELNFVEYDEIIICSSFEDEISKQLDDLGINKYSKLADIYDINSIQKELHKEKEIYNTPPPIELISITGNYEDKLGNKIFSNKPMKDIKVTFHGKNNILYLDNTHSNSNINILFGQSNGACFIGESNLKGGAIHIGEGSQVIIGDNVTANTNITIICSEGKRVSIGDDCMFARGNQIRTDDSHAIFDVTTKKLSNAKVKCTSSAK